MRATHQLTDDGINSTHLRFELDFIACNRNATENADKNPEAEETALKSADKILILVSPTEQSVICKLYMQIFHRQFL